MTDQKLKIPPAFKNTQEEAEFWDTHDVTEYAQSLKPQAIKYQLQPSQGITVRFRIEDLNLLRELANRKRIGVTTLIRMAALDFANKEQVTYC